MTGYITTCGGDTFVLPPLLEWKINYTFSVPCDSFSATFACDKSMAQTLSNAVRFTGYDGGEEQFYGVVDEYRISCGTDGRTAEISGRGLAALLLDNEARAAEYQYPTSAEIIRNHVSPYGIVCEKVQSISAPAPYEVKNGSSQWKAARDFARCCGGFEPRFTKTGDMIFAPWRDDGRRVVFDAATPVIKSEFRDNRYGVISEMLVVNKSTGVEQSIKNSEFIARGGRCTHVLYVPKSTSAAAMRYTGEYQTDESKKGKRYLKLTLPRVFAAFPFDVTDVRASDMGITGKFRITEVENSFGADGSKSALTMCEV